MNNFYQLIKTDFLNYILNDYNSTHFYGVSSTLNEFGIVSYLRLDFTDSNYKIRINREKNGSYQCNLLLNNKEVQQFNLPHQEIIKYYNNKNEEELFQFNVSKSDMELQFYDIIIELHNILKTELTYELLSDTDYGKLTFITYYKRYTCNILNK